MDLERINDIPIEDLRYLKLDCSNDPLTAALDLPELYNSLGDLKIMPDVQGDVVLFGRRHEGNIIAVLCMKAKNISIVGFNDNITVGYKKWLI